MPRAHPDLAQLAARAMSERGLEPHFPPATIQQAERLRGCASGEDVEDDRARLWCSIDNEDSRDLDQLTAAETLEGERVRIHVAIADVDACVAKDSPIDAHARHNTTSVYTPTRVFPMLPERLSTDLTSLVPGEDRVAVVTSFVVAADGRLESCSIRRALVRNHAKLVYEEVGAWLAGEGAAPPALAAVRGLEDSLRIQDAAAQRLRTRRFEEGALDLQTLEPRAVVSDGEITDLRQVAKNRAQQLIEDFMIAVNGIVARFLVDHGQSSIRRVVRSPERWDRLEALARSFGDTLPGEPDGRALAAFLERRSEADPLRFPDLSLTVVKLLGRGEYALTRPGESSGHFGLAVRDYTHSTAPNRRYPDLVTQRQIKAVLERRAAPYADAELAAIAEHCTRQEDAAEKVERQMRKSAAAVLLARRIGERFDALVTGASAKGTWVRLLAPPVEGKLMRGARGLDVGDRVRVRLTGVNVERGFIDFERAEGS